MAQKEVKQWITVRGRHIPIFEGESKEEAIKRATKAKGATKISSEDEVKEAHPEAKKSLDKDLKHAQEEVDKLKAELKKHPNDTHTDYIKEQLRKAKAHHKKLSTGDNSSDENFKTAKEWKNKALSEMSDEQLGKAMKLSLATEDAARTYELSKEAKRRGLEAKELLGGKKTTTQKQISKDLDKKEKQIAQNKAETDKLNSKEPAYKKNDDYENASEYRKAVLRKQFERNKNPYKEMANHSFETDKQTASREAAAENWERERAKYMASKEKKSFSAEDAQKSINDMQRRRANGGAKSDDWKQARDILEAAPAGTTMIETHNRGMKRQFVKGEDGKWHDTQSDHVADSKTKSMAWVGESGPSVEFTTKEKGLTKEQLKDSQDRAVSGKLNQQLGLDKNDRKIGTRMSPKVDAKGSSETLESRIRANLKKRGITGSEADKEAFGYIQEYMKGNVDNATMKSLGLTQSDLDTLRKSGKAEALARVASGQNKKKYIDAMGNLNSKKTRSEYEKNSGQDFRGMTKEQARKELEKLKSGESGSESKGSQANEEKLSKYKNNLANASNTASYLSWLVRSGKITEAEREQLRATYKKPKTAVQKQISKDLDTKEKQIAQHQAEADRLNGKSEGSKPIPKNQVSVKESGYQFAAGKKPKGRGNWAFYIGDAGPNAEPVFFNGTYAEAKKKAIAEAARRGINKISVGS